MNILDRLLLLVLSMIVAIFSFLFIFMPLPFLSSQYSEMLRSFIFESNGMTLISMVLLLLSLRFIFKITSSSTNSYDYVSKETEMGEIRISFNTIKTIALSSIRNIGSIKEAKIQVSNEGGEVSIDITASFAIDALIPEVSKEIQGNIKEAIERTAEINVKEVVVFVDDTNNSGKRRVG